MTEGYVHIDTELAQTSKKAGNPCGDTFSCFRDEAATLLVCCDGVGSGIRAHLAAEMGLSRILESMRLGTSLYKTFGNVVRSMERDRDPSRPLIAFNIARIRNDGMTMIVSYEAPPPILIGRRHAAVLPQTLVHDLGTTQAFEASCFLEPGDSILLMSDGVTQAGLGQGLVNGWTSEGVVRFVNDRLSGGARQRDIPELVHREACRLWRHQGDDITVAIGICRHGEIVNLFTGPPQDRDRDTKVVRKFLDMEGLKIVCGGSTADLVARTMRRELTVERDPQSLIAPPRYEIEGIDLVTEGAVTLNQVYNLIDEDISKLTEDSGVTSLCALLQVSDRINILMGGAKSLAGGDIAFRQRGILSRHKIIPLLIEKLRAMNKLVVLYEV